MSNAFDVGCRVGASSFRSCSGLLTIFVLLIVLIEVPEVPKVTSIGNRHANSGAGSLRRLFLQ
jgi:hypothetical protein